MSNWELMRPAWVGLGMQGAIVQGIAYYALLSTYILQWSAKYNARNKTHGVVL